MNSLSKASVLGVLLFGILAHTELSVYSRRGMQQQY